MKISRRDEAFATPYFTLVAKQLANIGGDPFTLPVERRS